MDLIIYQMMQLQVVHVTDSYRAVEVLACSSVTKSYLTVSGDRNALPECSVSFILIEILHNIRCKDVFIFLTEFLKVFRINIIVGKLQSILDINLVCAIEYRCCNIEAKCFGSKAQVDLQDLSDIHTGRHTQRIQHRNGISSTGSTRETTPLLP